MDDTMELDRPKFLTERVTRILLAHFPDMLDGLNLIRAFRQSLFLRKFLCEERAYEDVWTHPENLNACIILEKKGFNPQSFDFRSRDGVKKVNAKINALKESLGHSPILMPCLYSSGEDKKKPLADIVTGMVDCDGNVVKIADKSRTQFVVLRGHEKEPLYCYSGMGYSVHSHGEKWMCKLPFHTGYTFVSCEGRLQSAIPYYSEFTQTRYLSNNAFVVALSKSEEYESLVWEANAMDITPLSTHWPKHHIGPPPIYECVGKNMQSQLTIMTIDERVFRWHLGKKKIMMLQDFLPEERLLYECLDFMTVYTVRIIVEFLYEDRIMMSDLKPGGGSKYEKTRHGKWKANFTEGKNISSREPGSKKYNGTTPSNSKAADVPLPSSVSMPSGPPSSTPMLTSSS